MWKRHPRPMPFRRIARLRRSTDCWVAAIPLGAAGISRSLRICLELIGGLSARQTEPAVAGAPWMRTPARQSTTISPCARSPCKPSPQQRMTAMTPSVHDGSGGQRRPLLRGRRPAVDREPRPPTGEVRANPAVETRPAWRPFTFHVQPAMAYHLENSFTEHHAPWGCGVSSRGCGLFVACQCCVRRWG